MLHDVPGLYMSIPYILGSRSKCRDYAADIYEYLTHHFSSVRTDPSHNPMTFPAVWHRISKEI